MRRQGGLEDGPLSVCLEAPQALLRFQHSCARPSECHPGIAPALDVAADLADDTVDTLDHVGTGEGSSQLWRQSQAGHGEDRVEALQDGAGDARCLLLQAPGEIAQKAFGLPGIVEFPSLWSRRIRSVVTPCTHRHGGAREDARRCSGVVNLAALDRGVGSEGPTDRFAQGFRTVHHEQPADIRIKASSDQIVQQCLNHSGVFRRPLDDPERVLLPGNVNADGAAAAVDVVCFLRKQQHHAVASFLDLKPRAYRSREATPT